MNIIREDDFNRALGFRLMSLRQSQRMSQEHLGARLGVRYQQIQKYETGQARIPPIRLAACARIFGVPVEYFFGADIKDKPVYNKVALTVAAEIMALPHDDIRKSVYHLVRTINKVWIEQDNKNGQAEDEGSKLK